MSGSSIRVQVGLNVKVSNPSNQYENASFSRSLTRELAVADMPSDPELLEDYENHLSDLEDKLDKKLSAKIESQIQAEIDQYYEDNSE